MEAEVRMLTDWNDVLNCARFTMGKDDVPAQPTTNWKMQMLLCRHSPIQALVFEVTLYGIPYYVSTHLVRHTVGITHFVKSQRTDRTGIDRTRLPQDAPVNHRMILNAQSLIAISKKRLCRQASPETRTAWAMVCGQMLNVCPELHAYMKPECWWSGGCTEIRSCGLSETKGFPELLKN